jgi:TatD DNase family protein
MTGFIDTHCHLDAPEFGDEGPAVRARADAAGVALCVIPAVAVFNFATVRTLAHAQGDAYALGIHPLCTGDAQDADLQALEAELTARPSARSGWTTSCPNSTGRSRSTSSTCSCSSPARTTCR